MHLELSASTLALPQAGPSHRLNELCVSKLLSRKNPKNPENKIIQNCAEG